MRKRHRLLHGREGCEAGHVLQVTEMLHASLQAQGLAPNITVRTSSQMYEGASATD